MQSKHAHVGRGSSTRHWLQVGSAASALATVVTTGSAHAQTSDRFTINAQASVAYESNAAGGNEEIQDLRDVQAEDVSYTVGVGLAFQQPSPRQSFFLNAAADITRHPDNKNLDSESVTVAAGTMRRLGGCSASGGVTYTRAQSKAGDLTLPSRQNITNQEGVNGGLTCALGQIIASTTVNYARSSNSDKDSGFVNSENRGAFVSLGYGGERLGTISVTAEFSESSYSDSTGLKPPKFRQYGAGLSYSRKISQRLFGDASLSYMKTESDGAAGSSNGLSARVQGGYRLSSRSDFTLAYSLSNRASQTIFADFVRSEAVTFSASYRLNARANIQMSVTGSRDKARGGVPAALQVRENEQIVVSAGASYRLGQNIVVNLDAAHTERTADKSQFNFSSDRVGLGLTASF